MLHIKAGKLVLLAVTGANRSPRFPAVPTVTESGVAGYQATGWNALFAPAGTPSAIVRQLNEAVQRGFKEPDALEIFENRIWSPPLAHRKRLLRL